MPSWKHEPPASTKSPRHFIFQLLVLPSLRCQRRGSSAQRLSRSRPTPHQETGQTWLSLASSSGVKSWEGVTLSSRRLVAWQGSGLHRAASLLPPRAMGANDKRRCIRLRRSVDSEFCFRELLYAGRPRFRVLGSLAVT
jgi:hypothetical protein